MECRQAKIKFIRKLKSEEEDKLIGYFKGFKLQVKETLAKKLKGLDLAGKVGAKLGNNQIKIIQDRISALLLETTDENGDKTCTLDKLFALDWEESNPLEYSFIYPHPQTIFGMGEISKYLRQHKLSTDFEDKIAIKGLLKEADLLGITDKIDIGIIEREGIK